MKFAVAFGCLAVVGMLAAAPAKAQSVKIGYVDLQQALSETSEGKAIKAKLERLLKEIGRARVGKECTSWCRSRWSPDH